MAAPIAAKIALSAVTSKKGQKIIAAIAAALLGLFLLFIAITGSVLAAMSYLINPQIGDRLSESVHYQAIQAVKAQHDIVNDFDVSWLVMIDLLAHHSVMRSSSDVISFLNNYFVVKHEKVIVHEPENEDEDPWEETIVYYLFAEGAELMQTILSPPFSLTDQDIDTIRNMIYSAPSAISGELVFNGKFPMPMQGNITSEYGYRSNPFGNGKGEFHDGLDICGTWHDNVLAIAEGVVYSSNVSTIYGNNIIIEHNIDGQKFYSFYAHLSQRKVSPGQNVKQGQIIGNEGGDPTYDPNHGRSTGHHLHFGILVNPNYNSHIDPTGFLYD